RPFGITPVNSIATAVTTVTTTLANGTVNQPLSIPAPIVGQPVAYPAQTGQIADRIFVGDAEGRVWRVDVSDPDPSNWTMNVFYDASGDAAGKPEPVQLPPVLSVDDKGQITLAVATGDQDNLVADVPPSPTPLGYVPTKNYISSLTETVTTPATGPRQ